MGRADATRTAHETRPPPVGLTHDPVRRCRRLVRPQRLAGRRYVRPLPGRSRLARRPLAGGLRRQRARPCPRLLEVNRLILNNQLALTTGAKVSFTHINGYAVVRALHDVPALDAAFVAD